MNFSVYPNPTKGIVNIGSQQQFVEVYSIDGKLLLQDFTNQINIGNYQSGMYFLIIKDQEGNQLYKEKIIKE
ncbi:MAG: T9SS type A sorting domain-containing protein [Flavobacteriales bacterium]|nr:T9SS type A sorting domain-containing protein [Flavobacteriales bacterium]